MVHPRAKDSILAEAEAVWTRAADAVPAGNTKEGSDKLPSFGNCKQPDSNFLRITRKNSQTESIDNTRVINRSLLTSDILIIFLSLHYTFRLIDIIFYPLTFTLLNSAIKWGIRIFNALLEILFQ